MPITDFTTLEVTGRKTATFLHQLCTQDVQGQPECDSYCAFLNTKGRIIFDAHIRFLSPETAWIILPSSMTDIAMDHLGHYAKFSRVSLQNLDHAWEADISPQLRTLQLKQLSPIPNTLHFETWLSYEIEHHLPRVRPHSSEAHTIHMLNLQHLGGISFKKGCYLGQEITHRTEMKGLSKKGLYAGYCQHPSVIALTTTDNHGLYITDHALADTIPSLKRTHQHHL